MSYPNIESEDFLASLLNRKEFYEFKRVEDETGQYRNFRDPADEPVDPLLGKYLKIHSHQLFVRNFISPNTEYKRLLLMHSTGTGKTLASISIAQEFIKVYRKIYQNMALKMQSSRRNLGELDRNTPSVFVLGFGGTKSAFLRELLKHPEFGFISLSEKEELVKRQKIADAGLPDDLRQLKEYYNLLKKRVTNKMKDGFYKFYGYQEFVNRLFLSEDVKLTDLESIANQKLRTGENVTLEDIVHDYIEKGKIQVNHQLLDQFKNSLLICDEVHNTYNMNMKNNYGVAIQFVLDSTPTLRAVFMSATPINNSPTEIVEVYNYLSDVDKKVTKAELFMDNRNLRPGKLEFIGKSIQGKVSFLQDVNLRYFPKRTFVGTSIKLSHDVENMKAGDEIPYLKFIPCPMSQYHQETLNHMVETNAEAAQMEPIGETEDINDNIELEYHEEESGVTGGGRGRKKKELNPDGSPVYHMINPKHPLAKILARSKVSLDEQDEFDENSAAPSSNEDEEDIIHQYTPSTEEMPKYSYHRIPTDGYAIYDIVFPNPESSEYGLFRSGETKNKIGMAKQEWRDANNVVIKKYSAVNSIVTGDFLLKQNIGKYSSKCAKLLDIVEEINDRSQGDPQKGEKIMIYHDRVKMSGVLLIQELLRINNYIDEYSEPVDSTICSICGKSMSEHTESNAQETSKVHIFRPARFVVAHSDVDKSVMEHSLAKFNSPDNANGHNYKILIGSKIIKESYDFKDIQNLIIMTLPVNLPTLIQVFGRCIRKNSHINLPPEQRKVKIYILTSTVNTSARQLDTISPEEYRYIDKLNDYIAIQKIEREINRNAIDADIHRDIIMPPELYKQYFPEGSTQPVDTIGNLYFEPSSTIPSYGLSDLNMSTFTAYKYYEEEIKTISQIIKRLFMRQPVWTYDDLWEKVRRPPFGIEFNPSLFQEGNFIIALNNLVSNAPNIISNDNKKEMISEIYLIERIFDYNERFIYVNGNKHKIEHIGKYYILFPIISIQSSPLSVTYTEYTSNAYADKNPIKSMQNKGQLDKMIVDVETYLRPITSRPGVRINVENYVKSARAQLNFGSRRFQFIDKFKEESSNIQEMLGEYDEDFQKAMLEESIEYLVITKMKKTDNKEQSELHNLYKKIIGVYDRFRVIIYASEVKKYKDTAKQFRDGIVPVPDGVPIGYVTGKSIRLYDPLGNGQNAEGKWVEVSKISMNRLHNYKENDIIIGYFESSDDGMKFKLRKPIQLIKASRKGNEGEAKGDTRLIEKGIVCSTKNKYELLKILASLGVSVSKLEKGEIRIRNLCDVILNRMLDLEAKERQRESRVKYVYSFWDELPSLT